MTTGYALLDNNKKLIGEYISYATLAELETVIDLIEPTLVFCEETDTLYDFVSSGASYTVDHTKVCDTGMGGDTRRLGIAGQYIYYNSRDNSFYETLNLTSDGDIGTLPARAMLSIIVIKNNGGTAIDIKLGTTAGDDDILTATSIPAGDIVTVTIDKVFSLSADQDVYISSADWTGGDISTSMNYYFTSITI